MNSSQRFRELADRGWAFTPASILDMRLDHVHIRAGSFDNGYGIYWTDYVANDWTAWLPKLSDALAFTGVLAYCREHDFAKFLTIDPADFSAAGFYSEVTQ